MDYPTCTICYFSLLLSTSAGLFAGLSNSRQLPSAKAAPEKMGEYAVSGAARHGILTKKGAG